MIPEATTRNALMIQHSPETGPGTLEMSLMQRGYNIDVWWITRASNPPMPLEDYHAVLSLGGPGDPTTDEGMPWASFERRAIEELIDHGTPLIGVCLGAQLLAQVVGGKATREPPAVYGWQTVEATQAGIEDRLLGTFPARMPAFHWHAVSFEAPQSATVLATSDTNQEAFSIGSAWGVQYHPCVDLPQAAIWIEMEREKLTQHGIEPDQLRVETTHRMREYEHIGSRLINRLADHVEATTAH